MRTDHIWAGIRCQIEYRVSGICSIKELQIRSRINTICGTRVGSSTCPNQELRSNYALIAAFSEYIAVYSLPQQQD